MSAAFNVLLFGSALSAIGVTYGLLTVGHRKGQVIATFLYYWGLMMMGAAATSVVLDRIAP